MKSVRIEIVDTSSLKLDVALAFGGVPKSIWSGFGLTDSKSTVDRQNRSTLGNYSIQIDVLRLDGEYETTIVGTGVDTHHEPQFTRETYNVKWNRLLDNIRGRAKDVNRVVLPSLHTMHGSYLINYSTRGRPEPICPDAEFVIPEAEWDAAHATSLFSQTAYRTVDYSLKVLEDQGANIKLVKEDYHKIGPGIEMEFSGGVTAANYTVYVSCGSEKLMVSPLLFPTRYHFDPNVQFGFGFSREHTFKEKIRLLEKAEREHLSIVFPMDPKRHSVYVERDARGNLVGVESDILDQLRPNPR